MNPFYNPTITLPYVLHSKIDLMKNNSINQKKKDKKFNKILSKAYKIPLYQEIYNKHGINPKMIHGLADIQKLPFVNRSDISNNFPDNIVSSDFNKDKGFVICTGGTSGKYCCNSGSKPVCIYTDTETLLKGSIISNRVTNYHNFSYKKSKIAHIGNYNPFKFDEVFEKNILTPLKKIIPLNNYVSMQASSRTKEIIDTLNKFQPDVIISYPRIFQELAMMKKEGYGKNINPKILLVGGAMLDDYTKRYVEHFFNCKMYNTYASCEMGAEIAFECKHRNWHIHSDCYHLEAVDKDMDPVSPGERGKLVITRLWGNGTPIIRYTGMEDWITLSDEKTCSCGLNTPIFGRPVEGRITSNIMLPNGKIYPPSAFLFVTKALEELNTFSIQKFQIIQQELDQIEILLVLDEQKKDQSPSFKEISSKIINTYKKEIGQNIQINVIQVDEIADDLTNGKPAPLVISNINTTCEVS